MSAEPIEAEPALTSTLWHEIGHVAVAYLLRGDAGILGAVVVGGDGWQQGYAEVGIEHDPTPDELEEAWYRAAHGLPIASAVRDYVETHVIIKQAGAVAASEALRRDLFVEPSPEAREVRYSELVAIAGPRPADDGERVDEMLASVTATPGEADAWRRLLLERTWLLVERHPLFWPIAEALAPDLSRRRRLEREEVLDLINTALFPPMTVPPGPTGYSE